MLSQRSESLSNVIDPQQSKNEALHARSQLAVPCHGLPGAHESQREGEDLKKAKQPLYCV
jgi:hypothetical protein